MRIKSIGYPEGCQLKGWSRMVDTLFPVQPLVRMPELPLAPDQEPIFGTKVRTARPGATAISLARTVRNDAGDYEVSLTVTPVEAAAAQ